MKGILTKVKSGWEVRHKRFNEDGEHIGFGTYEQLPLHPEYTLNADLMYPYSNGKEIEFNIEGEYAVPFRDEFYITLHPDLQKSTQMVEKLKEHLHSITSEQFQKEWTDIQDEGYIDGVINNVVDGVYVCKDVDCPHCAYEAQEMWEDKLERDAAIDFAKWIAQDGWMSIWVEDKWMWECTNEQNELYAKYGYLTEEQLYELYLKSC